ncbi:hypothetical protein FACS1894206_00350 [Deltaproteobacteria bacterium]|nr:hypothetical protein FACS1894206_00350 [Deltaproteobacteria bacterium]
MVTGEGYNGYSVKKEREYPHDKSVAVFLVFSYKNIKLCRRMTLPRESMVVAAFFSAFGGRDD